MPDGTLVVGGLQRMDGSTPASDREPLQPCLHVVSAAGEILQTVLGTVSYEERVPRIWVSIAPWGTAYAVDSAGGFYAIFPDGRGRYRGDQRETRFSGPPVIGGDGMVYVPSSIGVRALQFEAAESPVQWALDLRHSGTPILAGDGTLRVVDEVAVRAIDPDGSSRWSRRRGFSGAVVDSEGTLYGRTSKILRAVTSDAEPKWEYEFETRLIGGPVVGAGVLYVITEDSVLNAVDTTGKPTWSYKLPGAAAGAPVVGTDGTIYVGLRTGALVAIGDDGTPRWSIRLPGSLATPALGADGMIYVESTDRRLYAIAPPPRG
jgi:outer membrane protein assembly factor BamB